MNARLVLLASLAGILATGACSSSPSTGTAGAASTGTPAKAVQTPSDPRDLLLKSLPSAETGSVRFAATGGTKVTGIQDTVKHVMQVDLTEKDPDFTLTMHLLYVEKKAWVKISLSGAAGLPSIPKKWMLIDPSKIKKGDDALPTAYADDNDPAEVGTILQAAAGVRQTSPGHFAGTTDISNTSDGDVTDAKTLAALGTSAKAVPFEATTDAQGRLRSVLVKIPKTAKTKASTYGVTYRDYGTAAVPHVPSGSEQQKATPVVYQMLNG